MCRSLGTNWESNSIQLKNTFRNNILFIIGWPLEFGGHIFSTLAYVDELSKTGKRIFLMAQKGPLARYFKDTTSKIFYDRFLNKRKFLNLISSLHILYVLIRHKIMIIHAQDFQALRPAIIAAGLTNIKLIFTKAGGRVPSYKLPPRSKIIVFSKELLHGISRKYNGNVSKNLTLVEPRIDTGVYSQIEVKKEFLNKHSLQSTRRIRILMCTRAVEAKRHLIDNFLRAVRKCVGKELPFVFIFSGEGILYQDLVRSSDVNRNAGRQVLTLINGVNSIHDIVQLYNYADIVIGNGRGIMEAMSCGKCVICIGTDGVGTIVKPTNVNVVSYYNFSGRHLQYHRELGTSIVDSIIRLAMNSRERKKLGIWGRKYIKKYYGAHLILDKLMNVYDGF